MGGFERSQERKAHLRNLGRQLLTRRKVIGVGSGDVRHSVYNEKHGNKYWAHGTHPNYERGVLARGGARNMQILLNDEPVISTESIEVMEDDSENN